MNKINEKINSSDNDENDSQIVNAKTSIRNKRKLNINIKLF